MFKDEYCKKNKESITNQKWTEQINTLKYESLVWLDQAGLLKGIKEAQDEVSSGQLVEVKNFEEFVQ